MTVFDLGSLHLITDRPDATPAPTAGPGDPKIPAGPWAARWALTEWPTVDELIARSTRTRADLTAAVAQSRRARGADTDDLRSAA